jgi:hypothetical protein
MKPSTNGTLAARKAWDTRRQNARIKTDDLPPHDDESEEGSLSCVLLAGNLGSQQNVEAYLQQLRPNYFYDHRRRMLHQELVHMAMANIKLDMVTLRSWLKQKKSGDQLFDRLEEVGGLDYLNRLEQQSPSHINFPYYLPKLKEFALRRWCLAKTGRLGELAKATELTPDQLREEFAEIYEQSANIGASTQPLIHIVSPAQARAFEPDPSDFLVGDGLITRGMIVTIGGDPGIGQAGLLGGQRDPEIDQRDVIVRRDHHVARLDVPMDHVGRVRVVEG